MIAKYSGYIERQASEIDRSKKTESKQIPFSIDYIKIPNLRTETRQKLAAQRPATLAQASRVSGVSPVDVQMIAVYLRNFNQT